MTADPWEHYRQLHRNREEEEFWMWLDHYLKEECPDECKDSHTYVEGCYLGNLEGWF